MKRISTKDLEGYSKQGLIELADHLMNEVDYSLTVISKLEKQLEKTLNELGSQSPIVQELTEQIAELKKRVFGRSSERAANFPDIFSGSGDNSNDTNRRPSNSKGSSKPKRKKSETKVSADTPVEDIFHYANDQQIAQFGLQIWKDKYEISELITIVPTTVKVERHHRQKYVYINADGERRFFTADGAVKLRDGAQYSIDFVANVAAGKYAFHLPLDRQSKMLSEKGLEIPTSSLQNQVDYAAFLLKKSVFQAIIASLQQSPIVEADDTTWPNLESLKTRTQDKYYLWGMKDKKAVGFNIYNARSQKVAKDFLGKQDGIVLSDAHNSFERLVSEKLILASDWAHTRRYFVKAAQYFPKETQPFLASIGQLFEIEKSLKDKPPDEILQTRQKESKPILDDIEELLEKTQHLKSSSLGRAISYMKRLWDRLIVFLHHPELPLTTNGIERAMRAPAVGRKNHLGSKNFETAKHAAIWYTITETCKLSSVNVEEYIAYALKMTIKELTPLMPWEYSASMCAS